MAPATHTPLARLSLDSSKYPTINAFLKSLKRYTRTLSALFAQHATELAVLERLYYLNNNQHRPALFWQRVDEARRYSRRLRSLDVILLVDGLRRAFYGDVTDVSSNLQKKGGWTHYPPAPALKSFLVRLRTCNALLDKTCVRMRAIYHTLTLAMQSGAFLQLVVTLTALVARLAHLSSALRRVLATLHDECLHLLSSLHPTEASPLRPPPPPPLPLEGEDTKPSALLQELNRHTTLDGDLDLSVDLGEAVTGATAVTSQPTSRSASSVLLPYYPSPVRDGVPAPVPEAQPADAVDHAWPSSAPAPSLRQAVIVKNKNKNRTRPSSSPLAAAAAEESREKRRKKVKKMQRDEIDDIFS